ncbi:381_t:CDS:2, partial [Acaulospora colombiana]
AIQDVQKDLHATTNEIALSLSLFILVQGAGPLIWSAISEIKGRKFVYIVSMLKYDHSHLHEDASGSRIRGYDIYATNVRGTMMGIFYAAPLVGQSLGPLFGVLTHIWNWRAAFYFLTIIG